MSLNGFVFVSAALVAAVSVAGAAAAETGSSLFADNCAACHQPKGQGVSGSFPALARNKFVQGDPKRVAFVLTHGRGGMPNFSTELNDRQIAAVLSYVRQSWGNKAPPLTPSTVALMRGAAAPPNRDAALPFH